MEEQKQLQQDERHRVNALNPNLATENSPEGILQVALLKDSQIKFADSTTRPAYDKDGNLIGDIEIVD